MVVGITVNDVMTKPVIKINYKKNVREAAKMMAKNRVGSIIVVKDDKPIGIITETDMNKKIIAAGKDPKKLKVKDVMSSPIVFSSPKDDILTTVEKMKKFGVKRIPVVDRGKIVGIVTNTDIARASPELLDILNYRLKMRTTLPTIKESSTSGICEVCGSYSNDLNFVDDQWVCENCRE